MFVNLAVPGKGCPFGKVYQEFKRQYLKSIEDFTV